MRRLMLCSVLALAAACGPKGADTGKSDSTMAAAPIPETPPGPQVILAVLYNTPKDAAAFEKYYPTHLNLLYENRDSIGFTKAELTKFTSGLDGKSKPGFYRQAELYFPNMEYAKKGLATNAFKTVAGDLPKFATGGVVALIATETGDRSEAGCGAVATVLYKAPKDAAGFETAYTEQRKNVDAGASELGVTRMDYTKFDSNLDGTTPAAFYRQGEICFASADDVKKAMASGTFKGLAANAGKLATGGMVGLIGTQQ